MNNEKPIYINPHEQEKRLKRMFRKFADGRVKFELTGIKIRYNNRKKNNGFDWVLVSSVSDEHYIRDAYDVWVAGLNLEQCFRELELITDVQEYCDTKRKLNALRCKYDALLKNFYMVH